MAEHATAYDDPGTPDEISRRTFLARATVTLGGLVGVTLAVSLVGSLVPTEEVLSGTKRWAAIEPKEFAALQAGGSSAPMKLYFTHKAQDGYLETASREYVWGLRLTPAEQQQLNADRPDLFATKGGDVHYPVVSLGFVIFSPICPHLGCRYNWDDGAGKFICPCHGSVYDKLGRHESGPAPRGLDPLPMREQSGTAEITWIQYETAVSDRIVIAYS